MIDIFPPYEKRIKMITKSGGDKSTAKRCSGWLALLLLVLFSLAGYFYYISYKVEVTITPVTEAFAAEKDILVRAFGSIGNGEARGVVFNERVSGEREFEVEGRRTIEERAIGEIKVCQDYRDSDAHFVEGTRFISDDGKMFFATEGFVLPPRQVEGGCGLVEVEAADTGEDYNIPSDSKFALPALQGTAIYGNVKGISFDLKKEGVSKEVPYLDDATMERAQAQMSEELFQKGIDILKEDYGEEYFIGDENQYTIEITEKGFAEDPSENGEKETFYFKLDTNIKVIGVGKEEMEKVLLSVLPEDHTWIEGEENLRLSFQRINFEEGEADIKVEFSADIYEKIDKEGWKRELLGKSFAEAEQILRENILVEDLEIKTKPFGLSKIPESAQRVEVILEFDKN